jgi:hypothetical protein
MTKFEVILYVATCIIALAIHPVMDFHGIMGFIVWGAVALLSFIAMLVVALNARWFGSPLRGTAIVAIAYLAPFAGLVVYFLLSTWGDFSLTPLIAVVPSLALWLTVPFGFPFAVALATIVVGARNAWKRSDRDLVAIYAAIPICAILCFTSGPFVADSIQIASVAPKLDAALQSGAGLSHVYSRDATVVVRPERNPAVVAYVIADDAFSEAGTDAEMVVRDLAGVGQKRAAELLLDVQWPRGSGCTSNARSMGGAYYYVAANCERR